MNTSKIIKAYIRDGTYSTTEPITQGDYGYILQIEGVVLPSVYRVDFSNDRHKGEALPVYGNENGVEVPEELIATGKDIFAFYYYIGENFGKTAYTWKIPNDTRAQNGNRVPTPTQQDSIDQLIARSNEAVESAEQSAGDAEQSAQDSASSAQDSASSALSASDSAERASASATNASQSASQASASATASAQSAGQSAQIKADVEDLADNAQASASASAQSATASANSASQASTSATSASQSATSAQGYASQAQTSAQTASSKASEASTSASTASAKATESAQSASQALTYKTNAESAKTASQTAQGLAESARDDAQTAQGLAENAEMNADATVHGVLDSLDLVETSGSIVETHDAFPVSPEKMVVDISPVQDLSHGDPSPENLCPISGWTEVNVEQRGVNVWDEEWELGRYNITTGEKTSAFTAIRCKNHIPVISGAQYYVKTPISAYFVGFDSSGDCIGILYNDSVQTATKNKTMTMPTNCHKIVFYCDDITTYNNDISINYPSTDHDYHPYTGRSITINLGQTVYGGKLDVLSGVLVITHKGVDMGSLSWSMQAGTGTQLTRFNTADIANDVSREQTQVTYPVMLDLKAPFLVPNSNPVYSRIVDNTMCVLCSNGTFYATCSLYTSAADFKTAVSGMMLVYRLAEPIEIQLTPQQITLFKDYNALWADTGDISEFAYRVGEFATKADIPEVPVQDVQVNGESVVQNKIANIDLTGIEQNAEDIASLEEDKYKPYATDIANGRIASFVDGADDIPLKSLVVDINPVQDLHGQDAPYPAGGGVNILVYAFKDTDSKNGVTWTKNSDGSITFSGTCSVSAAMTFVEFKLPAGDYLFSNVGSTFAYTGGNRPIVYIRDLDNSLSLANIGFGQSANGIPFSLSTETNIRFYAVFQTDNVVSGVLYPMIRLASVTDATYAPYENLCPISGWTGMNLRQCNENLWDDAWYSLGNIMTLIDDETSDFYGYYWGSVKSWANAQVSSGITKMFPDGVDELTVTAELGNISASANFTFRILFYYADGTEGYGGNIVVASKSKKTQTKKSEAGKKCIGFVISTSSGTGNPNGCVKNIMVSVNGVTDFVEPVQNPLIPISWQTEAGTVYGGKLDVLSGELTVDRAMVDLGTLSWYVPYNPAGIIAYNTDISVLPSALYSNPNAETDILCEKYKTCKYNDITAGKEIGVAMFGSGDARYIRIFAPEYANKTATEIKADLSGVKLIYTLLTPIEIQLSPNQVNSLLGVNNIWADSGDAEVEYRADTKLYIERLTAPDSADMVADANITSGKYFMVGNSLFKATANIANGAQIIVGTNCIRKSLSEALNEINA